MTQEGRVTLESSLRQLSRVVRWLTWPSALFALGAAIPGIWIAALALSWTGWPRILGLLFAVILLACVGFFARSRYGTLRAAEHPEALVAEVTDLQAHAEVSREFAQRLATAVTGNRLGIIRRVRALWRVASIPDDARGYLDKMSTLRWFTPPRVVLTWWHTLWLFWLGLIGWVAAPILSGLSISPVL